MRRRRNSSPHWCDARRGMLVFGLCVCAPALAVGQTPKSVPDLSGQWVRVGRYVESFDPPASGPGPMTIDPAHPHRRSATPGGQSPDGWVADLTNPILTPETRSHCPERSGTDFKACATVRVGAQTESANASMSA